MDHTVSKAVENEMKWKILYAFISSIRLQMRRTNPEIWLLKKQLIIVSSIEVHRLKFQMLSKTRRLFQMNPLIR